MCEKRIVILAGGFGTRLQEETTVKSKPMIEIGRQPILWHIMDIYAAHGYKELIVALGYKGEVIKSYFLNYYYLRNSFSIHLGDGCVEVHDGERGNWVVHTIDTGLHTETGGRIKRACSLGWKRNVYDVLWGWRSKCQYQGVSCLSS